MREKFEFANKQDEKEFEKIPKGEQKIAREIYEIERTMDAIKEKKISDAKKLVDLEKRNSSDEELSKEDLIFLYKISDSKPGGYSFGSTYGFGEDQNQMFGEIISKRDIKSDLSLATGYDKEQIGTTMDEVLSGDIKYYYGDLSFEGYKESIKGLKLPEVISGSLDFYSIRSLDELEGVEFPKKIGGDLILSDIESIEGLKLPNIVGRNIYLASLKSADGVEFPNIVGGWIDLVGLKSIEGLKLPEHIEGGVDFRLGPSNMKILRKQYPSLILESAEWVKD